MEYSWVIQFYLNSLDNDDLNIYENPTKEIIIDASNIENAIKSARQYIGEQAFEFNEWRDADIISVVKINKKELVLN